MNKSPLLVKITYILASTSHAKCWTFKYWWSALGGEVTCARACMCVCVCVCVCVCLHGMPRADVEHVLCRPRTDFRPRADPLDVRYWFWHQFQTHHPWKPRNWPQNYGGSLSLLLALKLFLESFIHKRESVLGYNLIHSSPHFTWKMLTI